jgi:hypothetical protein
MYTFNELVSLVIDDRLPLYTLTLYHFCLYFILGFFVGWPARHRGWLLGLIFGLLIMVLSISVMLLGNLLREEIARFGYETTLFRLLRGYSHYTLYSVAGAVLGGVINHKRLERRGDLRGAND